MEMVVLTGAGMSAESGIPTFRGAGGLWEGHRVEDVASPEAWRHDPQLVLDFYNARRRHLLTCEPNEGHRILAKWSQRISVQIVTQNVDDLHERAGSPHILHLHGELMKARSLSPEGETSVMKTWEMTLRDRCPFGFPVRPDIVWFGESVPMMDVALELVQRTSCLLVIGTSLQVYPAAQLAHAAPDHAEVIVIDPAAEELSVHNARMMGMKASEGLQILDREWFG